LIISWLLLLEGRVFQAKVVEKIRTHVLCSVTFFAKIMLFMR